LPLFVVKQDITKMKVDAVVNPANPTLLGGGGIDGEIHRAAGERLLEKCRTLGGCATGDAKITKGYDLPAKYIIHTVGPVWQGGDCGERELLERCYRNVLALAASKRCRTLAIPVISSGAYGYPSEQAEEIAKHEILSFIDRHDDVTVYLVMRERRSAEKNRLYSQIEYFMMQNGISGTDSIPDGMFATFGNCANVDVMPMAAYAPVPTEAKARGAVYSGKRKTGLKKGSLAESMADMCRNESSLEDMLKNLDMSFSETLLKLIDDSGMTDSECYKRANIDRKLFSKIRKDKNYRPSKSTVLAFAIALKLDLDDTKMLLERAGFALSPSSKFDVIIQYYITNGIYDVFEINDALFAFDQNLLGA